MLLKILSHILHYWEVPWDVSSLIISNTLYPRYLVRGVEEVNNNCNWYQYYLIRPVFRTGYHRFEVFRHNGFAFLTNSAFPSYILVDAVLKLRGWNLRFLRHLEHCSLFWAVSCWEEAPEVLGFDSRYRQWFFLCCHSETYSRDHSLLSSVRTRYLPRVKWLERETDSSPRAKECADFSFLHGVGLKLRNEFSAICYLCVVKPLSYIQSKMKQMGLLKCWLQVLWLGSISRTIP
jgi:hypothetical protein